MRDRDEREIRWRPTHYRPRPLPEPPRTRHVSSIGREPRDALGRLLEQWRRDVVISYTFPGD